MWQRLQDLSLVGRSLVSASVRGVRSLGAWKGGLMALAVAFALIGAGEASAQWPAAVPQIFDPQDGLDAVEAVLVFVAPLFIYFSLAIVAMYLIWRVISRFVGARS